MVDIGAGGEASRDDVDRSTRSVLKVSNLDVGYTVDGKYSPVLRDVNFEIAAGESFGLVGESGCGKSTTAQAITSYLPRNGKVTGGQVIVDGRDVTAMNGAELRELRAREVSVVYQEPGRALTPSMKIGDQVAEVFRVLGASKSEAFARATEALASVQISGPSRVMDVYPHQVSGGMLQRVVIAMALASEPALLILDEPTTALDATVEAEILELLRSLEERVTTATLFISHNLAVIAQMCDRVGVMYAGEIVEQGRSEEIFRNPRHPYTVGLMRCVPRYGQRKDQHRLETIPGFLPEPGSIPVGCVFAPRCALADEHCRSQTPTLSDAAQGHLSRCFKSSQAGQLPRAAVTIPPAARIDPDGAPLVRLEHISKTFGGHGDAPVAALADVNLSLYAGQTLGVVGESGSGKTTLARVMLGLTPADPGGVIEADGQQVSGLAAKRSQTQLRLLQVVFQDPGSALNRRHSLRHIIGRAVSKLAGLKGEEKQRRLIELVDSVRLEQRHLSMRPAQLSGGLKQRAAIARAFAGNPKVLICDEPTSALDVSVQAAILNLLADLQHHEHVTYLFISHDLGVVRYLADQILVLYLGEVMEYGPAESVFVGPHHPYTEALLSAAPSLDANRGERIKLTGEIPSPANPPTGCVFHTRCHRRLTDGTCENTKPPLREIAPGKYMRCHLPAHQLGKLQQTNNKQGGS